MFFFPKSVTAANSLLLFFQDTFTTANLLCAYGLPVDTVKTTQLALLVLLFRFFFTHTPPQPVFCIC
jgi:hypothetical protein